MKWRVAIFAIATATAVAGQDKATADHSMADGETTSRPPVLRNVQETDNVVVALPGAPARPKPAVPPPPASAPAVPTEAEDDHRPLLRRAPKPVFPAEFERDSAAFCQKLIGIWSQPDAYNLFGEPTRERIVLDDDNAETGRIFAFSDPTGRYREIELDFAKDTGSLRSVFVYPWKMTWTECRKLWVGQVQSTPAKKGRTFYSYVNRRLDVLVDQSGHVISLGLY